MNTGKIAEEDIKFTLVDCEVNNDECYFEIMVNRAFLSTLFLGLLLFKDSMPHTDIQLTNREKEVLMHISNGEDNGEIAKCMNVSIHTAKIHIRNIFQKLNVTDRTEAVVKAIRYNLIDIYY